MKKQAGRNGVYQTNDGNGRKSCAGLVRGRASIDDADTGERFSGSRSAEMRSRSGRRGERAKQRTQMHTGRHTAEDKIHFDALFCPHFANRKRIF